MISNNNNNNNNNDNNNSNNNNKSSSNNKNSNTDSNRLIYNNEKKDDDKDDEYNVQNKDNKKICITITTNKTLITDKTLTGKEREKKNTYLLHRKYEKATLSNMQRKHHVH